ncbi:predicted protein [Chaetomium globosum CBS 148.51]|uniref:ATP-dependent DNA helicase n=1 Tax=Chaetomium globosum (strain ATCC 6205 / CBS 148.51 / DSM 1962 / NBRC 6347 / NRRL 1970) TaxID=306901 RepID=Q2GPZ8_CHAGB|nr:uncharacterized protein CHGG_09956 [Chaetomium globosum CBS 148.51]EAQ83552.1 predicted protein [Chaetomium globosum CBS 148.51]
MVLFFGDFFQFDPVLQTSLLLPAPRDHGGQRPESLAKHLAAHRLFLQFTTVVILQEQVRAAGCPRLRGFLGRLRNGEQTELDFQRLSQRLYTPSCKASFVDGLRAITPLNQDRWDLNMAAVVQWARAYGKHISIFVAKHDTESAKRLRVEELGDVLRHGKPGFRWVTHRTGPLCTPAFAMTDQKSQGKQFSDVLVNLKGVRGGGTATRPSFMSLYVQLSRAQSWDGLHLFRKPARSDFIEPKNVLDKDMRDAILKLERQVAIVNP